MKGTGLRNIIAAIILSVGLIIAALIWVSIPLFYPPVATGGGGVDNQARIDLELMRGDLEISQEAINQLRDQADALEERVSKVESGQLGASGTGTPGLEGPSGTIGDYAQVVLVADRRNLNRGQTVPPSSWLNQTFGPPSDNLTDTCGAMTNPRLAGLLEERQVGPVKVKMLRPALDSLAVVLDKIQRADPDLYARINTAGGLCVRLVRGSATSASSHSFGLGVDLNIDGVLDTLGDSRTQLGLTIMSDFFNADGWVWGAAYGREDSMHFEVSKETIEQWIAEGKI